MFNILGFFFKFDTSKAFSKEAEQEYRDLDDCTGFVLKGDEIISVDGRGRLSTHYRGGISMRNYQSISQMSSNQFIIVSANGTKYIYTISPVTFETSCNPI